MYKRSHFQKYQEASSPNTLMIRLNSQNTPPRFIQDISKNEESSQYQQRKFNFAFSKAGSKSLDPNRRRIIDKKTLQNEYKKFLSLHVDSENFEEQFSSISCSTQKICLSKVIGKNYQLYNPF